VPERHPPRELLERFLRGEVGPPDSKRLVRHLIAGCARCLGETRRLWVAVRRKPAAEAGGETLHPACYGEAFRKVLESGAEREAVVARERDAAPALAGELLRHPPDRRLTMVVNSRRFRTVALCEHLLATAAARWQDDPAGAEELAELALAVAERVDPAPCGASLVASLQGRAWAYLGNARRLCGRRDEAEEAFARAHPLVDVGSGDPLERAEVGVLRAALWAEMGRPTLAAALYDRACHIYRALGEAHLLGRTLLEKSAAAVGLHETARLALLREGLSLLDERQEPRLAADGYRRLVAGLVEVELAGEALLYLQKAQVLFRNLDDRMALLHLRRLEGKIAAALGRPAEAERLLLEAWMGLAGAGLGQDAAAVTLDLALLYAREGRTAESRRLAEQLSPLFHARDLDRRAMPGLLVLQRILETESASPEFLTELDRYLRRPWLRRAS
jgi:tetratricopeptide (TPR) repeat protein